MKTFTVPTVMKHGPGAIRSLADELKGLGCRRPLVVTDETIASLGLLERATKVLDAANLDYTVFSEVVANPPAALVNKGAEVYRQEQCDSLIGLGGGSPMDTAKAMNVLPTAGGKMRDYKVPSQPDMAVMPLGCRLDDTRKPWPYVATDCLSPIALTIHCLSSTCLSAKR